MPLEPNACIVHGAKLLRLYHIKNGHGKIRSGCMEMFGMLERDALKERKEFQKFERVRHLQGAPHPTGQGNYVAFTYGRCHVLAIALMEQMPADLVLITPKDDPNYLVHAAVHRDGIITDAAGYRPSGGWHKMWEHFQQGTPLDLRRTTRAELEHMMPERPVSEEELAWARPFAAALASAASVDRQAWRAQLPLGATPYALDRTELDAHIAYTEALGKAALSVVPDVVFGQARTNFARKEPSSEGKTTDISSIDMSGLYTGSGYEAHSVGRASTARLKTIHTVVAGSGLRDTDPNSIPVAVQASSSHSQRRLPRARAAHAEEDRN